jgi:hypothetical protein
LSNRRYGSDGIILPSVMQAKMAAIKYGPGATVPFTYRKNVLPRNRKIPMMTVG